MHKKFAPSTIFYPYLSRIDILNLAGIVRLIDVKKIDPSPFQHRKYMDEEKSRSLP